MTEFYKAISWKNLKERTRLVDLYIEERITLKCILNKQDVRAWNGILDIREGYVPAPNTSSIEISGTKKTRNFWAQLRKRGTQLHTSSK
jgi:hypothetical protein